MPATRKQMRTAGRELRLRREGKVKQEKNRATATRPMGAMSDKNLRKYAQRLETEVEKLERRLELYQDNVHSRRLVRAKNQVNGSR